jgi:hypothetical protein
MVITQPFLNDREATMKAMIEIPQGRRLAAANVIVSLRASVRPFQSCHVKRPQELHWNTRLPVAHQGDRFARDLVRCVVAMAAMHAD